MTSLLESSSSTLDSSSTSASYDQWQEWAQSKRRTSRKQAEDLINGDCDIDAKTLQHFELPRKQSKQSSLIDDDDDDEQDDAPWKIMPRFLAARKSLLEDSDSDDDDDDDLCGSSLNNNHHHHTATAAWNNCDALFLPPTALRRAKNNGHAVVPRLPSNRSLMATSFSSLSTTVTPPQLPGTPKELSFGSCSAAGKNTTSATATLSPVPLAIITAMNSRRRFSVSRQDLLPVV